MSESTVYVLGSINADIMISSNRLPEQGETISGFDFFEALGGKGSNQAVAVARLGVETTLISAVGRDYQGQKALNTLNEQGVRTHYVTMSDREYTGTAIILRIDHDNRIIINQGANGMITAQQVAEGLQQGRKEDFFLTQFEVPLNLVLAGLKQAKQQGLTTVVNPAPALEIAEPMLELIDIMVLNQTESHELTGVYPESAADAQTAAQWFFDRGVKTVVITLGSAGSFTLNRDKTMYTPPYHVDVVDTTGAGDAFIGTMLYGLSQKLPQEEVMQLASAAGALACTKQGAQTSLPDLKSLQAFIAERK